MPGSHSSGIALIATNPAPNAFPLAAKYDPQWILDNALGENALCQVESLARHLPLRAGMRVLDLACGKATGAIFLAREFGVEVWAVDDSVSPSDNHQRAIEMGCGSSVFPLQLDAPEFLRPQYARYWSNVHTLAWWQRHWEKTGLVDLQCAELLPESDELLRDYVEGRAPGQLEDCIMRAVPGDHEQLIALFRLVARKR
jgi:hypothetical protein